MKINYKMIIELYEQSNEVRIELMKQQRKDELNAKIITLKEKKF